jgi:hypothetical protein
MFLDNPGVGKLQGLVAPSLVGPQANELSPSGSSRAFGGPRSRPPMVVIDSMRWAANGQGRPRTCIRRAGAKPGASGLYQQPCVPSPQDIRR